MQLRSLHALPGERILSPGSISLAYFVVASLWIYASDRLLLLFVTNELDVTYAQTFKGWAFVVGTSLLLYVLLRRWEGVIMHSQDELRREKLRYEALIEASPTPILTLDAAGRVTTWSPAAEAVLGWREEEVLGEYPPHVPPDRTDEFRDLLGRVLEGHSFHGIEARRRRKDGTPIDVNLSAAPFGNSHVRGAEVTLVDVTDRKRYEEGLLEAKERAEEMSRLKSTFLANMSHEIRTPLTAIMGFADILHDQTEGSVREDVEHIIAGSERLMETLGSLLDLAKLEGKGATLHPTSFDLGELARATLARYERKAQEQDLTVQFEKPDGPIPVFLDPDAVERVLANLLSNAVKFTRAGRITLALQPIGEAVELRVSDTGVGIAEDEVAAIFDAFHQESSGLSREFEGSGLGLTIASHLVDLMEGTIGIESTKGGGTTFTVRLPAEEARAAVDEAASETEAAPDAAFHERAATDERAGLQRLLLVEDNPASQLVVRAFVDDALDVDVVSSGRDAIRKARTARYDAVLLDISLGTGPSGQEVLGTLRQTAGYEATAIVALTAHAMPGDRERFLEAGFDGYLDKPFSREQLTEALQLAACVQRVRQASVEAARSGSLDEALKQGCRRGAIDRYDRVGEEVTVIREGVAFRLPAGEARAVLQLLTA